MRRSSNRILIPTFVVLLLAGPCTLSEQPDNDKTIIKITARKFEYRPSRIELKKGQPVTLELTSLDRIHGFNIPDLNLHANVLPGQSIRVELRPDIAGRFTFLGDIFCGNGHDEMSGAIVVVD